MFTHVSTTLALTSSGALTSTPVLWVGVQRVPKVAGLALVAVGASCIVCTPETVACQAVAAAGDTGVSVVVTLTRLARPRWALLPKGVPEVALSTEFTPGAWGHKASFSDPMSTLAPRPKAWDPPKGELLTAPRQLALSSDLGKKLLLPACGALTLKPPKRGPDP